jgi:hypothetical protein
MRDIIGRQENYRSFLDIYDVVQATLARGRGENASVAGMSHER